MPSGLEGTGAVYTPMCVMDFEASTHRLRLHSVNPGYDVDDVVKATGCELVIPAQVPQTGPPTDMELHLLFTQIDSNRVLKKYRLTAG